MIFPYISASSTADVIPADTNLDGYVTKADATLVYDYILGLSEDSVSLEQVDVNGDGIVNTVDVVEVYKYIKDCIDFGDVNVENWENGGAVDGGEAEEN